LPDWGPIQRRHPDVAILLVATDPASASQAIAEKLTPYRLGNVQTWVLDDEVVERVRFAVDRSWRGELPRTYFYDAAHHPEVQSGRIDLQWVEKWFALQGSKPVDSRGNAQ